MVERQSVVHGQQQKFILLTSVYHAMHRFVSLNRPRKKDTTLSYSYQLMINVIFCSHQNFTLVHILSFLSTFLVNCSRGLRRTDSHFREYSFVCHEPL